jgi:hypothetical protein
MFNATTILSEQQSSPLQKQIPGIFATRRKVQYVWQYPRFSGGGGGGGDILWKIVCGTGLPASLHPPFACLSGNPRKEGTQRSLDGASENGKRCMGME